MKLKYQNQIVNKLENKLHINSENRSKLGRKIKKNKMLGKMTKWGSLELTSSRSAWATQLAESMSQEQERLHLLSPPKEEISSMSKKQILCIITVQTLQSI